MRGLHLKMSNVKLYIVYDINHVIFLKSFVTIKYIIHKMTISFNIML